MINLVRRQIPVELLNNIPENELAFFVTLAHVDNTANAVSKMLYWALNSPTETDEQRHGRFSMTLQIFLLLAGVLFEHWRLLENNFYRPFWRDIEQYLPYDRLNALQTLRTLLSPGNNPIQIIRDQFAFHFPINRLNINMQNITDPFFMAMANSIGITFIILQIKSGLRCYKI